MGEIINVSEGKNYFSQRDNKIRPTLTCNTTSMSMALFYYNLPFPELGGSQPEDSLTNFLLTDPRVDEYYKRMYPDEYAKYINSNRDPLKSYPPNELHAVLAYGTNLWMGKPVVKFNWDVPIKEIMFDLLKGKPVVQSGVWNGLHHIICIVGFETKQEDIRSIDNSNRINLSQISNIIVDDPYGNYSTSYKNTDGDNVFVPFSDYLVITKPKGSWNKWAHRLL